MCGMRLYLHIGGKQKSNEFELMPIENNLKQHIRVVIKTKRDLMEISLEGVILFAMVANGAVIFFFLIKDHS